MTGEPIRLVEPERPLGSDRLLLEPLLETHALAVCPFLGSAQLCCFIPQEPPETVEALGARYARLTGRRSPNGREAWLNWAMRLREDPEAYVGLLQASVKENGTAHVAYTVFVPYQRRGFASEGMAMLLTHLFDDYRVAECVAEVDTRNAASIALLERLRFVRTGTTVGADVFKGTTSDEYRYERTSTGVADVEQESNGCF